MAQGKVGGRFVWQELMTEHPDTAAVFYSKLLGWHAQASSADAGYTEFHAGTRAVAGLLKTPDAAKSAGAKPRWTPYITVEDVDAAAIEITKQGGKVVHPATDIPTVGRFAVVADPQGAVFAAFKPQGPAVAGADGAAPKPGEFSWMELATNDLEAAFSFYAKLFGWQALHRHDMGPAGVYLIFGADGIQRGGIFKLGPERGSSPHWLPYAAVADADASAREIPGFGGHVVSGPMDVPDGGRIVHLTDPDGALFALHAQVQPKLQPVAKPAATAQAAARPAGKPATAPKSPAPKLAELTKQPAPPAPIAAPKSVPKPVAKPAAAKPTAPKTAASKPAVAAPAETSPSVASKPAKQAAKKAGAAKVARKPAKKSTRKAAKKAVKKAVPKVAKKAVKKAAKKVARKAAKKASAPKAKRKSAVLSSSSGKRGKDKKKDKHKKDKGKDKKKKDKKKHKDKDKARRKK
jgi:predicted enzyme related to lactoylglutathione lyase